MGNLYNISSLPNQKVINTVAILYHDFEVEGVDSSNSLIKLKQVINESSFMQQQDHAGWFYRYGIDYSLNPKLFCYAPLNVTCVFLSEIFKHYSIEKISNSSSFVAVKQALLRLRAFMIKAQNSAVLPTLPKLKSNKKSKQALV